MSQLIGAIILTAMTGCPGCEDVVFTVNSQADAPDATLDGKCADSSGRCTLRAAIMEANKDAFRDTIEVPPGTYHLDLPPASGGGRLHITSNVRIEGSGASGTVIDQDVSDQVIVIEGGNVEINRLTLQGGNAQFGGGIWLGQGGSLQLNDSVVRDNHAFTGGGGLSITTGSTATLRRTSILDNRANGAFGGGILNQGELWVSDSTIAGNVANRAGGIRNEGNMNLRNTTVSGNTASSPDAGTGGISQNGSAVLNNVTLTDNTGVGSELGSFTGGGIHSISGNTVVKNSIIAGNHSKPGGNSLSGSVDCHGALSGDSKYNLIGDSHGCTIPNSGTFKLDVPANLGPLANNGGPTQTHVPLANSQALNAAFDFPPPDADACEGFDQRGVQRPGAGACDMGAVEVAGASVWVIGFMLVDAATDADIRLLRHGDTLNLSTLPAQLSIRAEVSGSAGSVVFGFDANPSFATENVAPYALGGDAPVGDYTPVPISVGSHTVTATPFLGPNGTGDTGGSLKMTFLVQP
ncbi:MAG: hypothetical protein JXB05_35540 [Myxococcaceae bacterium]|nr:hypothetical protein [Myxococcaceae bacterium]